ncbi:HprK-related kinase A [Neiella marina]|uniref:HprK-related kinase A n=1 Tax=Neiella holothuriorum TaxID=2870530 RepID=A0ABS7EIS1_9GAMM|nr:HprK-related kinase A [Neiella holothuriorum]
MFEIDTPISIVQEHISSHYSHSLVQPSSSSFIDYHVTLNHGPLHRRLIFPQATFSFNHKTPFKPLPLTQAHAMLEWGMNWVISSTANQFLTIHAAALEKNGKAVIITATPGSGKSTLCAYLVSQGWRLLSDELALISPGTLEVHGLARPMNMKNKSIDVMKEYFSADSFSKVAEDTHKGTVCLLRPPISSLEKVLIPAAPALLVFIKYQPDEHCYVESIDKAKALVEVISNTFNFGLLGHKGFDICKRLIAQTDSVYIEYSDFEACKTAIENALTKSNQ